jgi:hypothetical protein
MDARGVRRHALSRRKFRNIENAISCISERNFVEFFLL